MSNDLSFGNGLVNPTSSITGASRPSMDITKVPFLGLSLLISTLKEQTELASRADLTLLALVLNAFQDLQCSIETRIGSDFVDFLLDDFFVGVFLALTTGRATDSSSTSEIFLLPELRVLLVLTMFLTDNLTKSDHHVATKTQQQTNKKHKLFAYSYPQ